LEGKFTSSLRTSVLMKARCIKGAKATASTPKTTRSRIRVDLGLIDLKGYKILVSVPNRKEPP
jgi:hypothetical protein